MIKLVASDIDGTLLLNKDRQLSKEVLEQIKQLKKRGILFVAASGRQLPNLQRLFAPVKDEIAYIAENGALVFYQGKILRKTSMDRCIGQKILQDIKNKEQCEILLSGVETSYLEPKTAAYEEHMRYYVKNNIQVVPDILEVSEEYLKISVYQKDGIDSSEEYFKNKWGDKVTVVTSGHAWLDMIAPNVNKGIALAYLMDKMGIKKEEAIAFGDNENDIEMLHTVFYSYAMNHANQKVAMDCFDRTLRVETVLQEFLTNTQVQER